MSLGKASGGQCSAGTTETFLPPLLQCPPYRKKGAGRLLLFCSLLLFCERWGWQALAFLRVRRA